MRLGSPTLINNHFQKRKWLQTQNKGLKLPLLPHLLVLADRRVNIVVVWTSGGFCRYIWIGRFLPTSWSLQRATDGGVGLLLRPLNSLC